MLCLNTSHDSMVCPKHEGAFDCTPFCDICEGEQEFCVDCDTWEYNQAMKYLGMSNG